MSLAHFEAMMTTTRVPEVTWLLVLLLLGCGGADHGAGASSGGGSNGVASGGATSSSGGSGGTGGFAMPGALVADGVDGTLAAGETVTIHSIGDSFGTIGPNLLLFDDFEGADGAEIPLTSPDVGAWSSANTYYPPLFSTEIARSGTSAFLAFDAQQNRARMFHSVFPAATEFFLSYWVSLPPGSHFPGKDGGVGTFSSDSSWKLTWLMDGTGHGSDGLYDMCLPTHVGGGSFYLGGNDGNWVTGLGNTWFDWYEWTRITIWGRAAPSSPSSQPSDAMFQTVSVNGGVATKNVAAPLFQGGTEKFSRLNVPGWLRESGGNQVRPHYDDFYFAVGPGSAARVEIGDAANYDDCTNLALALPVAWSSDTISVELRGNNDLMSFDGAYLFIHDADNQPVGSPRLISQAP